VAKGGKTDSCKIEYLTAFFIMNELNSTRNTLFIMFIMIMFCFDTSQNIQGGRGWQNTEY
jgi:hypothetical protein